MPPRHKKPGPVPVEALEYFRAKELKVGFDHREIWKEENSAAFTIAKVMEIDVLAFMRDEVARALEEGITFREFAKTVKDRLDRSGWANYGGGRSQVSRLRVIFDTNMRTARAAGQWQRIDRTKKTLPYLEYALGPSTNHREQHVMWAGTILPIDDPWWNDHMTPNGWNCRCSVIQIGQRQVERQGGVSTAPSSRKVPWENSKTGKTEMVPIGIAPGWDMNAGKDRMAGVRRAEREAGL